MQPDPTFLPPHPVPMASVVPVPKPLLRPVEHPDMSGLLTHFCHRSSSQTGIPQHVAAMSAQERLASILWSGQLWAFTTHSGGDPAVCLTEATLNGLGFLITRRQYQPWGLVFDRQKVYEAGGGPVWYVRGDEYYELRQTCSTRAQARMVRLDTGSSDWLEEREWRIPIAPLPGPYQAAVPLASLGVVAVLVGDHAWAATRHDWAVSPVTGRTEYLPVVPAALSGIPRWWWSSAHNQFFALQPY
ncbi:hypothetical protein [Dactylosporangium sp. CA-092794]|uniref:hypothetical protein n=1 Tax=Dactylosporangium sp. CA-092794 TaxID=3239929 RepID=UPI003D9184B5